MDDLNSGLMLPSLDWRVAIVNRDIFFINEYGDVRDISGLVVNTFRNHITGHICVLVDGKDYEVYRLIAEAFIETRLEIVGVLYFDDDHTNLRINNLVWKVDSGGLNTKLAYPVITKKGDGSYQYFIDGRSGPPVFDVDTDEIYANTHEAARALSVPQQNVYSVVNESRHTVGGHTLRYV